MLIATGAYLVDRSWTWSAGWVVAGLAGVGCLFFVGATIIGGRSRALRRALEDAHDGTIPTAVARITRDRSGGVASWANTGLALGIVFVMTIKPALAGSLAALAVAAGLGGVVALRLRRITSTDTNEF